MAFPGVCVPAKAQEMSRHSSVGAEGEDPQQDDGTTGTEMEVAKRYKPAQFWVFVNDELADIRAECKVLGGAKEKRASTMRQ